MGIYLHGEFREITFEGLVHALLKIAYPKLSSYFSKNWDSFSETTINTCIVYSFCLLLRIYLACDLLPLYLTIPNISVPPMKANISMVYRLFLSRRLTWTV